MSKLARVNMRKYNNDTFAGKLTLHRGKYRIIYNAFTKDHINDTDPASATLVKIATSKDVSTKSFITSTVCLKTSP